jgi:hypothetical protein
MHLFRTWIVCVLFTRDPIISITLVTQSIQHIRRNEIQQILPLQKFSRQYFRLVSLSGVTEYRHDGVTPTQHLGHSHSRTDIDSR